MRQAPSERTGAAGAVNHPTTPPATVPTSMKATTTATKRASVRMVSLQPCPDQGVESTHGNEPVPHPLHARMDSDSSVTFSEAMVYEHPMADSTAATSRRKRCSTGCRPMPLRRTTRRSADEPHDGIGRRRRLADLHSQVMRIRGWRSEVRESERSENGSDRPVDSGRGSGNQRGNEHATRCRKSFICSCLRTLGNSRCQSMTAFRSRPQRPTERPFCGECLRFTVRGLPRPVGPLARYGSDPTEACSRLCSGLRPSSPDGRLFGRYGFRTAGPLTVRTGLRLSMSGRSRPAASCS